MLKVDLDGTSDSAYLLAKCYQLGILKQARHFTNYTNHEQCALCCIEHIPENFSIEIYVMK